MTANANTHARHATSASVVPVCLFVCERETRASRATERAREKGAAASALSE